MKKYRILQLMLLLSGLFLAYGCGNNEDGDDNEGVIPHGEEADAAADAADQAGTAAKSIDWDQPLAVITQQVLAVRAAATTARQAADRAEEEVSNAAKELNTEMNNHLARVQSVIDTTTKYVVQSHLAATPGVDAKGRLAAGQAILALATDQGDKGVSALLQKLTTAVNDAESAKKSAQAAEQRAQDAEVKLKQKAEA